MKASLKGRYEVDKNGAAAATLGAPFGDVKFRASITDATVGNGPSLNGLSLNGLALTVEKPGFFIIDYNVPKKDVRFQFMNTVKVAEKPLNLTYIHHKGDDRTILEGTLVVDPRNKLSTNYMVGTGNCKLKYSYVHRGFTTFEPCYDLSKNSWDLAVSQKVGDSVVKATYQTSSRLLGLDLSTNSNFGGCLKISASVNLNDESRMPKLSAESTWNFDIDLNDDFIVSFYLYSIYISHILGFD